MNLTNRHPDAGQSETKKKTNKQAKHAINGCFVNKFNGQTVKSEKTKQLPCRMSSPLINIIRTLLKP